MYPGTAKFQTRPASPQFPNFSPPDDYPHSVGIGSGATSQAAVALSLSGGAGVSGLGTSVGAHHHNHNHGASMSMRHPKTMSSSGSSSSSKSRSTAGGSRDGCIVGSGHHTMAGMMGAGSMSMGHHRGDLIFPDDMDSIEFCMPPPPPPANGIPHSVNGEMLLIHGNNGSNGICEAFTERRRRGHSRRSNHKMDVEQQVKWSRKNIAATMERFEPTTHSSSSTSSLEYGFAAGVVTPTTTTPSHHHHHQQQQQQQHQQQISPIPPSSSSSIMAPQTASSSSSSHSYNGAAAAAAPFNHVYSYAYYEPGAAKCHTNIPHKEGPPAQKVPTQTVTAGPSKSPPRNSIRALLAKSFRSKSSSNSGQSTSSSPSTDDRHTYTTRYGTTENLYEEVNEQKIRKVLSDNRIATSSAGNVKEELRRVQHNHFRVLDELNLSLEALIMPPTPPDVSPSHHPTDDDDEPSTSAQATAHSVGGGAAAAVAAHQQAAAQASSSTSSTTSSMSTNTQRPRRGGLLGGAASHSSSSASSSASSQQRTLSHASLENLSTTLNSMELKEHHHAHSSCINPEFDEGDLDSGFSGSGSSSGASYNESLRYYKTGTATNNHHSNIISNINNINNNHMQTTTLPHNLRSCRSSTTSTSKSSMGSADDQGIGMMMLTALGGNGGGMAGGVGIQTNGGAGLMASPFNYSRRCSDTQRASARSASAAAAAAAAAAATSMSSASSSSATGTKPKKNFWTIKP